MREAVGTGTKPIASVGCSCSEEDIGLGTKLTAFQRGSCPERGIIGSGTKPIASEGSCNHSEALAMSTLTQAQTAIAELVLEMRYRPLAQLKPDPKNPRQHSKKQIRQLAESINAFGFVMPILIDPANRVVAGHARLLAAKRLGYARVPTISIEHLNDAQIAAYKIADNRLAELSDWGDPLLAEALLNLSLMNVEVSLELTGFDMGEIDVRIASLEIMPEEDRPEPADVTRESAVLP
jgi:hypothetical protein